MPEEIHSSEIKSARKVCKKTTNIIEDNNAPRFILKSIIYYDMENDDEQNGKSPRV